MGICLVSSLLRPPVGRISILPIDRSIRGPARLPPRLPPKVFRLLAFILFRPPPPPPPAPPPPPRPPWFWFRPPLFISARLRDFDCMSSFTIETQSMKKSFEGDILLSHTNDQQLNTEPMGKHLERLH
uniref:Uncharacterized protein n=1 Tax=Anopheles culicifacies TaxID=139723 RepID=A0A182LVT7_9DIPT